MKRLVRTAGRTAMTPIAHGSLGAFVSGLLVVLLSQLAIAEQTAGTSAPPAPAAFVGKAVCATCHAAEAATWTGSDHDLAMQPATAATVLGNFADATFDYHGIKSRFFRRGGGFFVETDGQRGALETFEIKYTFGVRPLQQYLVAFADGRLQALSIAWDSRPAAQGGQRWFHLYPDETISSGDPLHWTRPAQNWNYMCADCHTTGLHKNYDASVDRFATTWSEINVSCEACHGAGSRHVAWANAGRTADPLKGFARLLNDRAGVSWSFVQGSPTAKRSGPVVERREAEACGLCHARRGSISEDWQPGAPLSQTHEIALLDRGLFEVDGQMRDEVYNYQSFRQSRMFAAGVTCGDCHDPHSLKLKADGSGVCHQCHEPATFEAPQHRFHTDASVTCISCHMPARTYMVVDPRHDHGFRVPRPDLTVKLGTPNTCNACHADKPAQWAADAIAGRFGPQRKGFQTYAEAFHAVRNGRAGAAELLTRVVRDPATPSIARASALVDLGAWLSPALLPDFRRDLADPDPLVRIGALRGLERLPPQLLPELAARLLKDPVRTVRLEAVRLLARVPPRDFAAEDRIAFDQAAAEYIAAQRLNADRAEARTNLGVFFAQTGAMAAAEAEYVAAIRVEPAFIPATVNLADLYRTQQREADAERVLRQALAGNPTQAGLNHALGLLLVRLRRLPEALELLRKAAEVEPEQARYAYVYAVALDSAGRGSEAVAVLEGNQQRHPQDIDTLLALISINRTLGQSAQALGWAEKLYGIAPATPGLRQLLEELRRTAAPSGSPRLTPRR